jgi:hypothetical protein
MFVRKEMVSTGILGESQKVFAWSYEDVRGFDPRLVHCIMKLAMKKQKLVNSIVEAPS